MGLSEVNTSFAEILGGEMKTPRFGSLATTLVKCKLMYCQLLMEGVTKSIMSTKGVESFSESLEVCDEGHAQLEKDVGMKCHGHLGIRLREERASVKGTYMGGQRDIPTQKHLNCQPKPNKAVTSREEVIDAPNIHVSNPSPWVSTTPQGEVSPLSWTPTLVEKLRPLDQMGHRVEPSKAGGVEGSLSPGRSVMMTTVGGHLGSVLQKNNEGEASQGLPTPTLKSPQRNDVTQSSSLSMRGDDTLKGVGQDGFMSMPVTQTGNQPNRDVILRRSCLGRYGDPVAVALIKDGLWTSCGDNVDITNVSAQHKTHLADPHESIMNLVVVEWKCKELSPGQVKEGFRGAPIQPKEQCKGDMTEFVNTNMMVDDEEMIQGMTTLILKIPQRRYLGIKLRDGSAPLGPFTIFIYDPGGKTLGLHLLK